MQSVVTSTMTSTALISASSHAYCNYCNCNLLGGRERGSTSPLRHFAATERDAISQTSISINTSKYICSVSSSITLGCISSMIGKGDYTNGSFKVGSKTACSYRCARLLNRLSYRVDGSGDETNHQYVFDVVRNGSSCYNINITLLSNVVICTLYCIRPNFQHAHFIPIVGVGKRDAYELVHGDIPRQHPFRTTLRFTGPVSADSRQ